MDIIIKVKNTATLARIEEFDRNMRQNFDGKKFDDVIEEVKKEW